VNGLRRTAALAIAAAALVSLAACSGSSSPPKETQPPATAEPGLGGQHITVEAHDNFRFTPSVIEANPGKLTITLVNTGAVPHDLVLEAFNGTTNTVDGGQTGSVTIDIGKAGTYEFLCSFHASQGMKGTLVVR
jgi:plastocyanin